MKLFYAVFIIFGLISLSESTKEEEDDDKILTKLRAKCSSDPDCDSGQVCGQGGTCSCQEGHLPWLGQCLAAREHGQPCSKQIECTLSGK